VSEERCAARFTRRYDAALAEVWRAVTEPESLARWLAPPHGVTVVHSEPERVLELDWSPPGEPPSVVRIELRPDGENTILVLEHSRIEATLGMRYMRDWSRALERFESELNRRRNS
jgi:Activator of Hsp90 ATPase homolog 1-like protein